MLRWTILAALVAAAAIPVCMAEEVKLRRRLPDHFVKIGIGLEQREQIYDIQDKYEKQIYQLEKQIAELKSKQSTEILGLLTERQKTQLAKYMKEEAEAESARNERTGEEPEFEAGGSN
ncbi:hypothetical protein [Stratiformator vulcanicus]|uniref:LTXXQ motif protein n=1 Tax=Stratiformator vulcanicus TaxID=2527980 RepID=A0A517R0S7_9PLAN|nr:hypothetical protein [Stratiformator vulcanicus]QDT37478.1 hypothetical protein Pan189_18580 [Stratiformator vulcanicus]